MFYVKNVKSVLGILKSCGGNGTLTEGTIKWNVEHRLKGLTKAVVPNMSQQSMCHSLQNIMGTIVL